MIFYFTIILFSIIAYKGFEQNKNPFGWVCLFVAIALPVLIEGLRSETVGTDMHGYGSEMFYMIQWIRRPLAALTSSDTHEPGYLAMVYICYQISDQINLYMTVCALIKISLIYATAYKLRDRMHTFLFLFAYMIYFYCEGYSMMRQTIALAIITYAITFLEKSYIKYFILIVVAYLFHNSSLIALGLLPIHYIREIKGRYLLNTVFAMVAYVGFNFFFLLIGSSGLVKDEFIDTYTDSGVATAKTNLAISAFFMLIAITCWYFRRKNDKSLRTDQYFVFVLSVYTLTFLLLATKMETAFRISYYFFIPSLMALCTMIRKLQFAIRGIIITGCILAFFGHHYISCSHDLEGALPYKSEILDIFIPKEPE